MTTRTCRDCGLTFIVGLRWCPHCGRPSYFPNVDFATEQEEVDALRERYSKEVVRAESKGHKDLVSMLENHVGQSCASKGMRRWDLERLAVSDTAVGATYYQQITGKSRVPDDDRWDRLRRIADASFFQSFGEDIHFAALSTEERWLANYGDGAIFFRDDMIAHRATVFEKNTACWVDENNGNLSIPKGSRASWQDRSLLAVAKLGPSMPVEPSKFGELLLKCGTTSADDSFIEVHICGSFTFQSAKSMLFKKGVLSDVGRAAITDRAAMLKVEIKEVP